MPPIEHIILNGPDGYFWRIMNAWWVLVFAHWITDYGLQTKWMAENKHRNPCAMLAHCGLNGAGVMLMTYSVELAVAEMVIHWRVDRAHWMDGRDQLLHILTKGAIVLVWWHMFPKG
jgi:hypothetical protein